MADLKKFEEMLERLINEDKAGAEELFHEIVVEKSREIYENLLSEEEDEDIDEADKDGDDKEDKMDATGKKAPKKGGMKTLPSDTVKEDEDEEVDEASDDEDLDEDFNLDEFEVEADPMDAMMGGDETDDMMGDMGDMGDEEGGMDGEEGDVEDRVADLEDALDELKAEFEKLMAGEEGEEGEEGDDMDMDMGDEEGEEDEEETEEGWAFESKKKMDKDAEKKPAAKKSSAEEMREYVEKVAPAKMGDNGVNTKSAVAGKNDMGGTTANIAKGGTESGVEANKGQLKGNGVFKGTSKEDSAGNVNVPGGKASKLSSVSKPKMGDTGTNGTKSIIGQ